MFARHLTVYPHSDKLHRVADLLRDDAIPFYRAQPGYRGFLVLLGPDSLTGVNLWASREAWETVRDGEAHTRQKAHFAELTRDHYRQPPTVAFYDVPTAEVTSADPVPA